MAINFSMMMKNSKPRRKSIALLLTMALLFNAMSPLFFTFNADSASTDSGVESLFGDKILICTSTGFKYISIEDFKNGDYPQDNSSWPHCPLCIVRALVIDKFIPAIDTVHLPFRNATQICFYDSPQNISQHEAVNNTHSRAPPYFL